MKGAKDRSIRSSVPPRREVNVQANGTDQKEIAEGLDAIDAAAFKAALSNASTPVTVVATDGPFGRAGLTCSAVSSVCDTPPTILLCVNRQRSEEHTSELQSLMRISYAVFCLKKNHTPNLQHASLSTILYTET